jgi:hypothetical protein
VSTGWLCRADGRTPSANLFLAVGQVVPGRLRVPGVQPRGRGIPDPGMVDLLHPLVAGKRLTDRVLEPLFDFRRLPAGHAIAPHLEARLRIPGRQVGRRVGAFEQVPRAAPLEQLHAAADAHRVLDVKVGAHRERHDAAGSHEADDLVEGLGRRLAVREHPNQNRCVETVLAEGVHRQRQIRDDGLRVETFGARAGQHLVAQVHGHEIVESERGQRLAGGARAGTRVEHARRVLPRQVPRQHLRRPAMAEESDLRMVGIVGVRPVRVEPPEIVTCLGGIGSGPDRLEARIGRHLRACGPWRHGRDSAGGAFGHGTPWPCDATRVSPTAARPTAPGQQKEPRQGPPTTQYWGTVDIRLSPNAA